MQRNLGSSFWIRGNIGKMKNIGHWCGGGGMCQGWSDNISLQINLIPVCTHFVLTLYCAICYIVLNLQLAFSDKITVFSSIKGITRSCALSVFNSLLYRKTR